MGGAANALLLLPLKWIYGWRGPFAVWVSPLVIGSNAELELLYRGKQTAGNGADLIVVVLLVMLVAVLMVMLSLPLVLVLFIFGFRKLT